MKRHFEAPGEGPQTAAGEQLRPWTGETRLVGKPLPRVDAYERVSGTAEYTQDVILPNMLYAAILRCPHAHAMVKSVDAGAAEKMPGVAAVITAKTPGADIPFYNTGFGPGASAQSTLFDPHCRYVGDEVAALAAQTPYQAADALKAIKVEYEVLPFVLDEDSALKADAPKLHGPTNSTGNPEVMRRGDVEKGFAEADVVLEQTFTTSVQIHLPMETHGSVVRWDGDRLVVWDSTQGVFDGVLFELAGMLKMPPANIRVICKYMGGGFGSKAEVSKYTVIAALLARRTARPVKLVVSREDSFLAVGNRPQAKMTMKAGVRKDGTLTALQMTTVNTPGAYAFSETFGFQVAELYKCPNVLISESAFYSNTGRARWFRAPGFPAGNWALEQMMDMLAEKLNMDPVDLRLKNYTDFSQTGNIPYTSAGLKECLIEGAKAFGWAQARSAKKAGGHIKRGVGVSGGVWQGGNGGPPCTAEIRLFADGGVTIKTGAMDIGTGTKTVACMVAAEELGMPIESIRIENADTSVAPYAPVSGGSMTLPSLVPAVRTGATLVKRQIMPWAAEALGVPEQDVSIQEDSFVSRSDPAKKKAIQEVFRSHGVMDVIGIGNRGPNPEGKAIMPFGAHFAEVEVNTRTGEVRVLRLLGANESGRVINRKTFDNQVIGGMNQALGYALTEKRVVDRQTGRVCNANFYDYKIPTALDVAPDHQVLPIDPGDMECNNCGCKGLGEPAHVPTAAAIANAVYDAIGVRPVNGPLDPKTILELLSKKMPA